MSNIDNPDSSASSSNAESDTNDAAPGYISSPNSTPPPTIDDRDRWHYHIDFKVFGDALQEAANAVFPNDSTSRYTKVSVLILSWQDEDPQLPVSQETDKLFDVFTHDYDYATERWSIPDDNSHWKLTEKIMDFVRPDESEKTHLKIVYYAGHARLTETRTLVWTSWRNNSKSKCPMVKWGGIQTILEESLSDVLILLDCGASGTANVSDGNGVNELISACAFNETAQGVGPCSFTSALVTELKLLRHKPSFSVGELYKRLFFRTQSRMPEEAYRDGSHRERYPAPIHLVLSHGESGPRGIQMPQLTHRQTRGKEKDESTRPDDLSPEPVTIDDYRLHTRESTFDILRKQSQPSASSSMEDTSPCCASAESPRLLFSIRLRETFRPDENMSDLLIDWIRSFPSIADEMTVEATYNSHSTIMIISLPIYIAAYLPQNPSIVSLGLITSENRLTRSIYLDKGISQETAIPATELEGMKSVTGHLHRRSFSVPDNGSLRMPKGSTVRDSTSSRGSNASLSSYISSVRSSINTVYSRSSFFHPSDEFDDSQYRKSSASSLYSSAIPLRPAAASDGTNIEVMHGMIPRERRNTISRALPKMVPYTHEITRPLKEIDKSSITYTCLLGMCNPSCGFPCFNTHHFQRFSAHSKDEMWYHLSQAHGSVLSMNEVPDSWLDNYDHSSDGWSCASCHQILGTWPTNREQFESHYGTCPTPKSDPQSQ